MNSKNILIVSSGDTNDLADSLSRLIGVPWVKSDSGEFPNEELKVRVPEVGDITILLGSLAKPVNTRVIEYLLTADAIKRAGCRHIIGLLSWYAYSKQDKVFLPGEPLSAKVMAQLLQDVSIRELLTLDLHNPSIAGYFEIPVTNLSAAPLFVDYISNLDTSNSLIVSPDAGSIKNSTKIADELHLPIAYAAKTRDLNTGEVTITEINRDISNKDILIFDDMIASGSTMIEISEFVMSRGAKTVTVCSTHHLYLPLVQQKLDNSPINHLVVTNSITKPQNIESAKLSIIDSAPVFAAGLKDLVTTII